MTMDKERPLQIQSKTILGGPNPERKAPPPFGFPPNVVLTPLFCHSFQRQTLQPRRGTLYDIAIKSRTKALVLDLAGRLASHYFETRRWVRLFRGGPPKCLASCWLPLKPTKRQYHKKTRQTKIWVYLKPSRFAIRPNNSFKGIPFCGGQA